MARIIRPGGFFITQQIGGLNDIDLSQLLLDKYKPALPNHNVTNNVRELEEVVRSNGFIQGTEHRFLIVAKKNK